MKDGRELDALVAEQVMGWTIAPEGNRWRVSATGDYNNSWCVDSPRLADLDDDVDDRLYGRYAMPAYSTDIAAAMQVVERVRQHVTVQMETGLNGGWFVQLRNGDPLDTVTAGGPELPDCICRAALQAVGTIEQKVGK